MPAFEASAGWTFTSTGAGKAVRAGMAQSLTFNIFTSANCTASVQVQTKQGSSGTADGSTWSVLSTLSCTLGENITDQFIGPLKWVRPYCTDKTASAANTVGVRMTGV